MSGNRRRAAIRRDPDPSDRQVTMKINAVRSWVQVAALFEQKTGIHMSPHHAWDIHDRAIRKLKSGLSDLDPKK